MEFYLLLILFFVIAIVYSSVGFAGGSSYVALLAIAAVSFEILRPAALLCNILVATGGTAIFFNEKLLDLKRVWPFLVTSVPFAFIGGNWPIHEKSFFLILGFTLILASVFLWIQPGDRGNDQRPEGVGFPLFLGAGLGFLSGIASIGGGIFLSPILHFRRWDQARKISALSSLFILVNSISGLAGQLTRSSVIDWGFVLPLLVAVFAGGQIGSRLGATRLNPLYIKRITAVLILLAGINIVKDHV